jgi:hypothetical protein
MTLEALRQRNTEIRGNSEVGNVVERIACHVQREDGDRVDEVTWPKTEGNGIMNKHRERQEEE